MIKFDDKVEAVLDHYHKRMKNEAVLAGSLKEEEIMNRRDEFLLPVGDETAIFLNSLIKSAKSKCILEIGTSYGYSTIFMAEAAKANNGKLISLEISPAKAEYAKNKIDEAGLSGFVEFRVGDAMKLIEEATETLDFILLDLWKELYLSCFNLFYPKLNKGAWVVADNIIYPPMHQADIDAYLKRIKETNAFDSVLLPIGSGIEVSHFKN